jgi:NAD(P)-dependent dehydrogenase (short-subunit alcohol dehydrogenase family)
MKILIVGGKGTIGKKVASYFTKNNEVLIAGRNSGDVQIDIADSESIKAMFKKIGKLDAIINIAGDAKWDFMDNLSEADYHIGLNSKLMGQVNLVRIGREYLNENGSITLTTGILADDPVAMTSSAAMVNGGIHSFVKAAQLELPKLRLNVVSSGLVMDALEKYRDYFPGHTPIPMDKVLRGYIKSVEGKISGEVIRIYE